VVEHILKPVNGKEVIVLGKEIEKKQGQLGDHDADQEEDDTHGEGDDGDELDWNRRNGKREREL